MTGKQNDIMCEETPQNMMKRVFAVAELIVRSDGYRLKKDELPEKHKTADSMYRNEQDDN